MVPVRVRPGRKESCLNVESVRSRSPSNKINKNDRVNESQSSLKNGMIKPILVAIFILLVNESQN